LSASGASAGGVGIVRASSTSPSSQFVPIESLPSHASRLKHLLT
jgi:hypothetical protein